MLIVDGLEPGRKALLFSYWDGEVGVGVVDAGESLPQSSAQLECQRWAV